MANMVVVNDHEGSRYEATNKPLVAWNMLRNLNEYRKPSYAETADGSRFNYHPGRYTSFCDWMHAGVLTAW